MTTSLDKIYTNSGKSLQDISSDGVVMLVFLRHFGCVFCRDSLKDLSSKRQAFAQQGVDMVFVHMTDNDVADTYFDKFGLEGATHISDPSCQLYQDFGLLKGNFTQLFGLKTMIRGFEIAAKGIYPTTKFIGDGFQMPGIFMLKNGKVTNSFIHKLAIDVPDYEGIVKECLNA